MNNPTDARSAITQLTTDIVAAYVSNNSIPEGNLPDIIRSVHKTMQEVENPPAAPVQESAPKLSAGEIKKSITHDGLVSFVDGKRYKTLKRHLTMHSLTPEQYRTKFGLPNDYPMTAKSYSEQRAELARALGLGRRNRLAETAAAAPAETAQPAAMPEAQAAKPARGGRRKAEAAPSAATETKTPAARGRKVKAVEAQPEPAAPQKTARKTKAAAAKTDGAKTARAKGGGRNRKGKGSAEASATA